MLDILLLIIFAISLVVGIRRGFIVQLIHLTSFFIALIVAWIYYKPLAEKFVLWIPYPGITQDASLTLMIEELNINETFYRVVAFAVIFFLVKVVLQVIASIFDFLTHLPVLHSLNRVLGAALCFVEFYFIIFILLYVLALLPVDAIQKLVGHSIIAGIMLEHTPIVTQFFQKLWYIYNR